MTSCADPGPGSERPGPAQRLGEDGVELADVAEGEGAQERPERRRRHDPVSEHRRRGPRAQHVGVVDVAAPATMACTKVSTLRPGSAPPTRPDEVERWR